jgi:hypothetical protein
MPLSSHFDLTRDHKGYKKKSLMAYDTNYCFNLLKLKDT